MGTSIASLPSALTAEKVARWLAETTRRRAVFLDYDGTLTPIVARPSLAILSDGMRETLRALVARMPVTIVSGRDIDVITELVDVPGLGFVGSHGLDIAGPPGSQLRKEVAREFEAELDLVETELRQRVESIEGVLIERKRFSISTHVREVAPTARDRVASVVDKVRAAHPALRREGGKMLFELRPDIAWDKGAAVRWLLEGMDLELSAALFIGDDQTDETVFRVLAGQGLGIVVADDARASEAGFRLRNPDEVQVLLDRLVATLDASPEATRLGDHRTVSK